MPVTYAHPIAGQIAASQKMDKSDIALSRIPPSQDADKVSLKIFFRTAVNITENPQHHFHDSQGQPVVGVLIDHVILGTLITAKTSLRGLEALTRDDRITSITLSSPIGPT
jgi:hypothetical protein